MLLESKSSHGKQEDWARCDNVVPEEKGECDDKTCERGGVCECECASASAQVSTGR